MSNLRFSKIFVAINCALPGVLLGWDAYQRRLGANPVNDAIKTTGLIAVIFLILTLMTTPVRKLTGWNILVHYRRTLGLAAFFYALGHFSIYFVFDRSGSISSTVKEILARPYLMIGATALLAMLPLAITSTNAMIKALGAKRWNALHRLTYLAIIAGTIHYYLQAKSDKRQPTVFIIIAVILLAYRGIARFFRATPALKSASPSRQNPDAPARARPMKDGTV